MGHTLRLLRAGTVGNRRPVSFLSVFVFAFVPVFPPLE